MNFDYVDEQKQSGMVPYRLLIYRTAFVQLSSLKIGP